MQPYTSGPPQPGVYGPPKPKPPVTTNVGLPAPAPPTPMAPVSAKAPSAAPSAPSLAPVAPVPAIGVAHARPLTSPQDYLRQRADGERQKQMREAHQAILSMSLGRMGKYGGLADDTVPYDDKTLGLSGTQLVPGDGLNRAMAAMQAHYAALAQGDAHNRATQAQFGGDIRHDPAYRSAQIGHLNAQSAHATAQAAALDPTTEAARIKQVMADPTLRAAYEAKIGVPIGSIPVPPTAPIGVNGQPAGPAYHVGNAEIGPDQWQTPIPLGPLKEWVGGPMMNFASHLTGQGGTGTGFDWRRNYDDGQQEDGLINKYGIKY